MKKPIDAERPMRFAMYLRYSSEMQNEISLEEQEAVCRRWIAARGGRIAGVFRDGAETGWTLNRPGLVEMNREAARGRFDALIMWKFDRLARDPNHAVVIKAYLRHERGLKLFAVEGGSLDDDGTIASWLNEQIYAVFSALYSMNLSVDTKRSKYHRVTQGKFNGSIAPFGYYLVTEKEATEDCPAGLYIDLRAAALVRRIFRLYATGDHSDHTIAQWLNKRPYVMKLRAGQKPFSKEAVRDILQNRHYTGRVCYAETQYRGTLGEGKRSNRKRKQWFDGRHAPIVSDELFEACEEVRRKNTKVRRHPGVVHPYLLQDKVFCARCMARKPLDVEDATYGKMRAGWLKRLDAGSYRCQARDRGYHRCDQSYVLSEGIDQQVVNVLRNLTIPDGVAERIDAAVAKNADHEASLAQIDELNERMERIDLSWESGFLTPDEYITKRRAIQAEIEALRPLAYDDLEEAVDLIRHFGAYWNACGNVDDPDAARQQLLGRLIDRVFVYDDVVVGIALYADFSIALDAGTVYISHVNGSIQEAVEAVTGGHVVARTQSGSDGGRSLTGYALIPPKTEYQQVVKALLNANPVSTA
jgi:site-specific DNA recombinase